MDSWIAQLRKSDGLTQRDLAEAMARELSKHPGRKRAQIKPSARYLQKRLSEIESGYGTPNAQEIAALSSILHVPGDQLLSYFKNPGIRSALELFERLTRQPRNSLMLACFSGRPRLPADPEALDALRQALKAGFCFAMCVPFPKAHQIRRGVLETYYESVRERVRETREYICRGLDMRATKNRIVMYEVKPNVTAPYIVMPPYFSRYALVAEELATTTVNVRLSLFLWVETAESRSLQSIGTMEDEGARTQIEAWSAYFSEPLQHWMEHKTLPTSGLRSWAVAD
jgi:transcriptional regulator with XRE-family HTH domain